MNRLLTLAVLLLSVHGALAQQSHILPQGAVDQNGTLVISQPKTLLAVDVELTCDKVIAGPYARYAQRLLGVRPALTDKSVWAIRDVTVSVADPVKAVAAPQLERPEVQTYRYTEAAEEFPRLPIDRTGTALVPESEETAAANAANALFSLRRHRQELVTGEVGENVFGAGLQHAIEEIDRMEQAYLELFLGKRTVTTSTRRILIYPQADKKQYMVCRFSVADGVLPTNDLSGDMVILQIDPQPVSTTGIEAGERETSVIACRVAAPSNCVVSCGNRTFGGITLPIFEFGKTINVSLRRR